MVENGRMQHIDFEIKFIILTLSISDNSGRSEEGIVGGDGRVEWEGSLGER